ncbi:hypothetical protein WN943_025515 [Citrus x changshan-huyou]
MEPPPTEQPIESPLLCHLSHREVTGGTSYFEILDRSSKKKNNATVKYTVGSPCSFKQISYELKIITLSAVDGFYNVSLLNH